MVLRYRILRHDYSSGLRVVKEAYGGIRGALQGDFN